VERLPECDREVIKRRGVVVSLSRSAFSVCDIHGCARACTRKFGSVIDVGFTPICDQIAARCGRSTPNSDQKFKALPLCEQQAEPLLGEL